MLILFKRTARGFKIRLDKSRSGPLDYAVC